MSSTMKIHYKSGLYTKIFLYIFCSFFFNSFLYILKLHYTHENDDAMMSANKGKRKRKKKESEERDKTRNILLLIKNCSRRNRRIKSFQLGNILFLSTSVLPYF